MDPNHRCSPLKESRALTISAVANQSRVSTEHVWCFARTSPTLNRPPSGAGSQSRKQSPAPVLARRCDHQYRGCVHRESGDQLTFIGGFVYSRGRGLSVGRGAHASRPFGRLSIDSRGVEVTFRGSLGNKLLSKFGNRVAWQEVERIQAVRGLLPFPGNVGIKFYGVRRVIFWCSPTVRDEILQAARQFAPPTLPIDIDPKLIVFA